MTPDGPPYEGVPEWLIRSLVDWLAPVLRGDNIDHVLMDGHMREPPEPFALQAERVMRLQLDWRNGVESANASLLELMVRDDDLFLRVVDFALARLTLGYHQHWTGLDRLERMLRDGGSVYEVDRDSQPPALRRRVSAAAAPAVGMASDSATNAGDLVHEAWEKTFGRHPDASGAYSKAVQAVEAAAQPIVSPSDTNATLGKMARALRDKPEKWQTPMPEPATVQAPSTGQPEQLDGVLVLATQMELLWRNQTDRHGNPQPRGVTPHQAEFAVHEAMALGAC